MSPFDIIPASFFNKPWHRFKNTSGEEIPAYACMRIVDAIETDNDIVFEVDKPNDEEQPFYLVNGPLAVAANTPEGEGQEEVVTEGRATLLTQGGYVLVSGGPVFGDRYGPTDGAWDISESGIVLPFLMLGSARSDPTRAAAVQTGPQAALVATAKLSVAMCAEAPGEEVAIEDFCLQSGGSATAPTTAFNWFGRLGMPGDLIKLEYWLKDPNDCSSFPHWAVTQVTAAKTDLVVGGEYDTASNCIVLYTINGAFERCNNDPPDTDNLFCFEICVTA